METNTDTLISIIVLARESGHSEIAKMAVAALAKEYGILVSQAKSLEEIRLYTNLSRSNRIEAIKELRQRAMENGLPCGLLEAKREIDRRCVVMGIDYRWVG